MNIDDFRKNPHDAFFRLLMSEPKNIKAYTERILPKAVHAACRWNELEIVQTDFIDEALNERRSDLLYRVPCGAGVIAIHILLEHQSTYDSSMPLRLLEYMTLIWRRELRMNSTLTQIVPLVLYHGSQPWVNTSLSDMMEQIAGLRFKGLSFNFEVLDVSRLSMRRIKGFTSLELRILLWQFQLGSDLILSPKPSVEQELRQYLTVNADRRRAFYVYNLNMTKGSEDGPLIKERMMSMVDELPPLGEGDT